MGWMLSLVLDNASCALKCQMADTLSETHIGDTRIIDVRQAVSVISQLPL